MADWSDIARENLEAARRLDEGACFRSSVSRAYFAAFSAATFALTGKLTFKPGREAPEHSGLPRLLEACFQNLGVTGLRELKQSMRRLYFQRLNADYRSGRTVDQTSAREARRDAYRVCRYLRVLT